MEEHLEAGATQAATVPAPKCAICDEALSPTATRTGYELGAFVSSPLPLRIGQSESDQAAGSFFPTWDSTSVEALDGVSVSPVPEIGLPRVLHVIIGGTAYDSSHLWEDHPDISRLHLLADTSLKSAAPAQDVMAVNEVLRRLAESPLDILFLEMCPAAGGSPLVGPESSKSIELVHDIVLTLAETCAAAGSRVMLGAPITSMAWRNKSAITALSDQKWHRFRAPSPRQTGASYAGRSWLWYTTCDTLAASIESHKDLSPLQTLVNTSCTGTDPDAGNSAKMGG